MVFSARLAKQLDRLAPGNLVGHLHRRKHGGCRKWPLFSMLGDQPKPGTLVEEASAKTINRYKSCGHTASVEDVFLNLLGKGGLLGLLGYGRVLFPGSRHLLLPQFMDQKFHSQISMLRTAYRRL
jgi:hypothetical protein